MLLNLGAIGAAAGGLVGGLVGLGVPDDRAKVYSDRISRGEYLVFVEGTDSEIATAKRIFSVGGIQDWGIYDVPTDSGRKVSGRHKRSVGVFSTRSETEQALTELRTAGFDMNRVSVIAKDVDSKGEIAAIQNWGVYDYPSVDTACADYGAPGAPGVDTTADIYDPNRGVSSSRRL